MITIRRLTTNSFRSRLGTLPYRSKKLVVLVIPVLIVLALAVTAVMIFRNRDANASTSLDNKNAITVAGAKKKQDLNTEFAFPIHNANAEEVGKITYMIQTAELRDEIIVEGKKATSIPGRTFLVLTLKITNDLERRLQINTRDYIRLSVNDSGERLEFTIHNDPVEIGAISTRPTRLAIPIDDVDQKLTLYVGEIKGEKQTVDINFN
ncbi:hypothetical protein HY469_00965 [Candidatus Roizmanbacteria bacterium]|nr:hypothetical protein [Candidatus Roizmanbacteria bacterium]